jgi:uncharacterized protein with HEPN domain
MTRNRDPILLNDMIATAEAIAREVGTSTLEQFSADWKLNRACRYALLTITEATKNLSDELKARHPALPWPKIKSLGDRLRHEYHRIDDKTFWETLQQSLPELLAVCKAEADKDDAP